MRYSPQPLWRRMLGQWQLWLLVLPLIVYLIVFKYIPMYGIIIAFEDFKPQYGYLGSPWAGLKHFRRLFGLRKFSTVMKNTLGLSLYSLAAGFPLPILLALCLSNCESKRFTKIVQTVTYMPHFISTVVLVGMILIMFAPSTGIVRNIAVKLNLTQGYITTLTNASSFPHLYVWSGIWQGVGWSSIIYLSALTAVDPTLHEAAIVDGAGKLQRVIHIDLPSILPTIIILLIMDMGKIISVGFEKVFLLQNDLNIKTSEVLSTYVYKLGIKDGQYSFSTAVNLFTSVVNFLMLWLVNAISRKINDTSLW